MHEPSETRILFVLTLVVGGLSGLAAVAFHLSIDLVNDRLLAPLLALRPIERTVLVVLLLVVVGLVVGIALDKVVPFARGSGIPEVKTAYLFGSQSQLSFRTAVGKFLLGALSIGAGFSLGREGPTVQICASIGAAIGRVMKRPARMQKALICVGSAAGIAAAFNTPIAAITFALEEIVGDLNQRLVGAIVVAAVAAAVVERAILGGRPVLTVPNYSLGRWWELFWYAGLGLISGVMATVFVKGLLGLRVFVRGWRALPAWSKPAIGGLLMASVGLLFPQTFGIGYSTMSSALVGQLPPRLMTTLSGAKLVATVISYGWGLSGGIFAPSLFIGSMLGGAVGSVVHRIVADSPDAIGSFALVGMGAFFAGAIRAPITSVLIIFEMTGDYAIILPLMISNVLSYTVSAWLQPVPIYDALLAQDDVPVAEHHSQRDLRGMTVEQSMPPFVTTLRTTDSTGAALEQLRATGLRAIPVVDEAGLLVGIVGRADLARAAPSSALLDVAQRDVVTVFADQSLDLALLKLGRHAVRQAPVVTRPDPTRVIGMLSLEDISSAIRS
jgi:CIC family chloride channel protein